MLKDSEFMEALRVRFHAALKRADVRAGIQAATGFFLMLAVLSTPAVWNGISLPNALISPVYAVVSFSIVMQGTVGTSLSYVVQRTAAAITACILAIICMYITYGANGASYAESFTKGAVMTVTASASGFVLAMCAYRFPHLWFGFIVAGLCLPIVALSAFHQTYVEYLVAPYFLIQVVLGVAVGAIVPMLVLPNTAGGTIRNTSSTSLKLLGKCTKDLLEILLQDHYVRGDLDGKKGQMEGSSSSASGSSGSLPATESLDSLKKSADGEVGDDGSTTQQLHYVPPEVLAAFIEQRTHPISAALGKAKALLIPVATEIDVYHRPRIFPRQAYITLLDLLRH